MKNQEQLIKYFNNTFNYVDLKDTFLEKIENSNLFWKRFNLENIRDGNNEELGIDWIEYFNNDPSLFSNVLKADLNDWKNKDIIYFCVSRSIIIKSIWEEFLLYWDIFLEFDDDSAFVLNFEKGAIFFDPNGVLSYYKFKINKDR